jgi:hypothetical protein
MKHQQHKHKKTPDVVTEKAAWITWLMPIKLSIQEKLYAFLNEKMNGPRDAPGIALHGFMAFEGKGAFRGQHTVYEEGTVMIVNIFRHPGRMTKATVQAYVKALGDEVCERIASGEEEVWVPYHLENLTIFKPQHQTDGHDAPLIQERKKAGRRKNKGKNENGPGGSPNQ